ncbi:MAG: RidA family protein [Vampirovibrionia bacterium]
MSKVIEKLNEMGYTLPAPVKPVASYVPALRVGDLVFTSGNLPIADGKIQYKGEVGGLCSTTEEGAEAARLCTLNALSSINDLIGGLDKITQVVKVTGFVKSAQLFSDQPKVLNGASDFLKELFGPEIGSHTRSAIGVNELPLNASVEVELIVQVRSDA